MLKDAADLDLGQPQHLKLMPFQVCYKAFTHGHTLLFIVQVDGFNWLCNNWWNRQHCILADEMGLVSSSCPQWFIFWLWGRVKQSRSLLSWGISPKIGRLRRHLLWCQIQQSWTGSENLRDGHQGFVLYRSMEKRMPEISSRSLNSFMVLLSLGIWESSFTFLWLPMKP